MSSIFSDVPSAPLDPIMRLFEAFHRETRQDKLNLVVGVYGDEDGNVPRLNAVKQAEQQWIGKGLPKTYRPIEGTPGFRRGVQALLFGKDAPILQQKRAVTLQSIGGTGALKIGADVLKHLSAGAKLAVSNPSWENHRALFEEDGFEVVNYPYYNAATHSLDWPAMREAISALPAGSIVVLHACCHNPTGYDLSNTQWRELANVVLERDLVPFIDMAYQGFGQGLDQDAFAVRLFAEQGREFLIASSFSKSFSLYGERVGALTIVAANETRAKQVEALAKRLVRTNYSNPPTHGAEIVESVLQTPALRSMWEEELTVMRQRIKNMRHSLVSLLEEKLPSRSFAFVNQQNGMFSYSSLNAVEAEALRVKHGIYILDTGRICVAALNPGNLHRVANAVADVSGGARD